MGIFTQIKEEEKSEKERRETESLNKGGGFRVNDHVQIAVITPGMGTVIDAITSRDLCYVIKRVALCSRQRTKESECYSPMKVA